MEDRFWPPPPFFVMDRRNVPVSGERMVGMETTTANQIINPPTITVPEYHLSQVAPHGSYAMSGESGPRLTHMFPVSSGDGGAVLDKPQEYPKFPVTTCNQEFNRFPVSVGNLAYSGHAHFGGQDSGAICGPMMQPEAQGLNLDKIYGTLESSRRNVTVEPSYPDRLLNLSAGFKEFVEKSDVTEVSAIDVGHPAMNSVNLHVGKQTGQQTSEIQHENVGQSIHQDDQNLQTVSSEDTSRSQSASMKYCGIPLETQKETSKNASGKEKITDDSEKSTDENPCNLSTSNEINNVESLCQSGEKNDTSIKQENGSAEKETVTDIEQIMKDIEKECCRLKDCGEQFFLVSINEALQIRLLGSDQGKQFLDNNPDLAQKFLSYCYKDKVETVDDEADGDDDNEDDSNVINDVSFEQDEPSDSETLDEVVRRVVSNIEDKMDYDEDESHDGNPKKGEGLTSEDKILDEKTELETSSELVVNDKENTSRSKRKRKGVPRKLVRRVKKEKPKPKVTQVKKEKPTKDDLTCEVCKKVWPSLSKLERHKKTHTGEKSYSCTVCDKKYTRLYNLKDHMNTHKLKDKQESGELKSDDEDADRLQCRVCNIIFSSSRALSRHSLLHTSQVLYSCEKCGKNFKRSDTYKIHLSGCTSKDTESDEDNNEDDDNDNIDDEDYDESKDDEKDDEKDEDFAIVNKNKKKPQCNICHKKFKNLPSCKMHIKVVHVDKDRYSCTVCSHKCSTKSHMNRHMKVHDKKELFRCDKCEKGFKYEQSLKEHVCKTLITKGVNGKHPCQECGKEFNRRKNLLLHLRTHQDRPAKHQCPVCSKPFRDSSNLRKHVKFVHSSKRDYICDICGKGFKQNDTLKVHVQSHNPVKTDKYKCNTCGKLLSGSTALVVHERSHLNIKPFVCDVCGLAFSQSGNLQKHLLSHTDAKFYKCEICDKEFKYIETWKAHQRAHALKEGRDDASKFGKVYVCEYCGKKCATASQHKVHQRTHTNERPFPCQYCGKSFKESGKLKRHRKTHLSNNNQRVVVHDIKIESPITIKNYYSHHPETNQTFYNM